MYYAKQIDENGNVVGLQSMSVPFPDAPGFVVISEEEYMVLQDEMDANQPEPEPTDEISDAEALAIITGEVEA